MTTDKLYGGQKNYVLTARALGEDGYSETTVKRLVCLPPLV